MNNESTNAMEAAREKFKATGKPSEELQEQARRFYRFVADAEPSDMLVYAIASFAHQHAHASRLAEAEQVIAHYASGSHKLIVGYDAAREYRRKYPEPYQPPAETEPAADLRLCTCLHVTLVHSIEPPYECNGNACDCRAFTEQTI